MGNFEIEVLLEVQAAIRRRVEAELVPIAVAKAHEIATEEAAKLALRISSWASVRTEMGQKLVIEIHRPEPTVKA